MSETAKRQKHDFLWAACIVGAFGALLGSILLLTRGDPSPKGPDSRLLAEAQRALAEGDQAASDQYMDYTLARRKYTDALDLLRSTTADYNNEKATVRLKIVHTFLKEENYRQAGQQIDILRDQFPEFRPEEVRALHDRISAGPEGRPTPDGRP